jgi:RNA polymerase sigma-70 factor (ECF subfamily)
LLEQVLAKVESEYARAGNEDLFAALKPSLLGEESAVPQAELAARLGSNENALKQALFRMRQRYRALLRAAIAETVAAPEDIEPELRHLVSVLRP